MSFVKVCSLDDLWQGEMDIFEVAGREVLLVHASSGKVHAFKPTCPHQDYPLIDGALEGNVLTCAAHLWQFDVDTGQGINPVGCALVEYALKIDGSDILVDPKPS